MGFGFCDVGLKILIAWRIGNGLSRVGEWIYEAPADTCYFLPLLLHMDSTNYIWNCTCTSASEVSVSILIASNCSTSCDCQPADGGSSGDRWTCGCNSGELPDVAADSNCFTACDCSSGPLTESQAHSRSISGKIVLIILLECLGLGVFAAVGFLIWYIRRRGGSKPLNLFSDKGLSCNSTVNLISHELSSAGKSSSSLGLAPNIMSGCFGILFRSKEGSIRATIIQFSYSELVQATNRFSDANLVGLGGSSHVYRGYLKNGKVVAVKRFKTPGGPDADYVFLTEIELLSRLNHYHVVPLLGFCSETLGKQTERLLVFDYMPNGNLRECLDGTSGKFLDWNTRGAIALGAARGLEYLHEASAPRILHRDVKSTNILLDEKWRPKITDLGMAKRLNTDGFPSCSSSPARMQGTFGYFAPEYAIVGRSSLKSDVFSFGVVLLELITGRKPISTSVDKGQESLVLWASARLQKSRRVIAELADPQLNGHFAEEEMQIMAFLAKECLLLDPDSRPNMSEVVQILSTIQPKPSKRRKVAGGGPCNQIDAEDHKIRSPNVGSARRSAHLDADKILGIDDKRIPELEYASSPEFSNKLIHIAPHGKDWRYDEEIVVDLIEPRLETFSVGNVV
ncbi:Receptor-like serine/threonine-protein kinase NCRK-like protein [Drosera capensis]